MSYRLVDKRFQEIKTRSFQQTIKLFLFNYFINNTIIAIDLENKDIQENYSRFLKNIEEDKDFRSRLKETFRRYNIFWEYQGNMDTLNNIFDENVTLKIEGVTGNIKIPELYSVIESIMNKYNIKKKKKNILLNIWSIHQKFFERWLDYNTFRDLYGNDDNDRKCTYCGITEKKIESMINKFVFNKKFNESPRGFHMEIDRKNPGDLYFYNQKEKSIVLACYWCNNAKTDEFTSKEFGEIIAPSIRRSWNDRLSSIKEYPIDEREIQNISNL